MIDSSLPDLPPMAGGDEIAGDKRLGRPVSEATAQVCASHILLFNKPYKPDSQVSELVFGEQVRVSRGEEYPDGRWVRVTNMADRYRGWAPASAFTSIVSRPTHRVATRFAHLYPAPDIKRPQTKPLPFGSWVSVIGDEQAGFYPVAGGHFIRVEALIGFSEYAGCPVEIAVRFIGSPYLWGGRTPAGLDCSALVQLALMAAGVRTHRDSDLQRRSVGKAIDAESARYGDLVFFPGHVGFLVEDDQILHANATHMAVSIDPLEAVTSWIEKEAKENGSQMRGEPLAVFRRPELPS